MKPLFFRLCALAAFTALAPPARAGGEASTDQAVAQTLFEEARTLMDAGHYDQACDKLAHSQRLDPAGGTVLNLALCHERQGRLATAWTEYGEARRFAQRDRREDRVAFADERIAVLEPELPRLRVLMRAPQARVEVSVDDAPLDRAAIGLAIPVDPGKHVVRATMLGAPAWAQEIEAVAAHIATVEIPALAERTDDTSRSTRRQTIGWTLIGVGGAAAVTGIVFGAVALAKNSASTERCPANSCQDLEGVALSRDADTAAWVANVSLGSGLVAGAIGTYLVLSSAPSQSKQQRANPPSRAIGVGWRF